MLSILQETLSTKESEPSYYIDDVTQKKTKTNVMRTKTKIQNIQVLRLDLLELHCIMNLMHEF